MREIKFRAWRKGKMYEGEKFEVLLNIASIAGFTLNAISPSELILISIFELRLFGLIKMDSR